MQNLFLDELKSLLGGASTMSPLLIVGVVIALIFAIVIIIVNLRLILDIAPYAYPNARVRSMQGMLIKEQKFKEVIEMESIMNIASALEDTEYGKIVSKDLGEEPDAVKIEVSLNQNLVETYLKISQFLPGNAKKVFDVYMKKFEAGNIKTILRGIYGGTPAEEITRNIAPVYREGLREVLESSSVVEAVAELEKTEYGTILSKALPEYEKTSLLFPLETALDKYVYEKISGAITAYPSQDVETIKKLIGAEIDILNIKIILRARVYEIKAEKVLRYLIPYGYELSEKKLAELSAREEIEGIINELDGTSYYDALFKALSEYKGGEGVEIFERALDEYYVNLGNTIAIMQPFGLGPILGYIVTKAFEVHKLVTIFKLKIEGFPPEEIRKAVHG